MRSLGRVGLFTHWVTMTIFNGVTLFHHPVLSLGTTTPLAQRLRQETTVTWNWIARGLVMGASGYAADCVRSFLSGA
jgi:hypothetical protein